MVSTQKSSRPTACECYSRWWQKKLYREACPRARSQPSALPPLPPWTLASSFHIPPLPRLPTLPPRFQAAREQGRSEVCAAWSTPLAFLRVTAGVRGGSSFQGPPLHVQWDESNFQLQRPSVGKIPFQSFLSVAYRMGQSRAGAAGSPEPSRGPRELARNQ